MVLSLTAFPDAEAIVGEALRDALISNISTRVYSSIPKNPTYPLITYQRIGGLPAVRDYMDAANIQVEVWGGTKSQAFDAAAEARVTLIELEGTSVSDPVSAWISAVEDSLGLSWQPDPLTGRDRYLFAVTLYARAMVSASGYGVGGYGEGGYGD
jgi:hypothetical protein